MVLFMPIKSILPSPQCTEAKLQWIFKTINIWLKCRISALIQRLQQIFCICCLTISHFWKPSAFKGTKVPGQVTDNSLIMPVRCSGIPWQIKEIKDLELLPSVELGFGSYSLELLKMRPKKMLMQVKETIIMLKN